MFAHLLERRYSSGPSPLLRYWRVRGLGLAQIAAVGGCLSRFAAEVGLMLSRSGTSWPWSLVLGVTLSGPSPLVRSGRLAYHWIARRDRWVAAVAQLPNGDIIVARE